MIPEEKENGIILTYEERIEKLNTIIENINKPKEWAGDLEISAMSIMLNIKITLYIKDNFYYKKYWDFVGVEEPTDYIDLIFKSSNHFDILYNRNYIFKRKSILTSVNVKLILFYL